MSHQQTSPHQPRTGAVSAAVLVAHGGRANSTAPVTPYQPAVLRMIPVAGAIRRAVPARTSVVTRPLYRLRGWNGDLASPVADLTQALDQLSERFGPIPVVLVGHSMGARAAMRVAGHPQVTAVAGLAPWLPPGEPVEQLAGRRVLVAHGTADAVTNPQETWAYVERARAVTQVTAVEVRDGDHPMVRRARLWHAVAAEFARTVLELPAGSGSAGAGSVAAAVAQMAWEPPRTIV